MSTVEQYKHLIAGEWTSSKDTQPNINPSNTNDIIACTPIGSASDVDDAVSAAKSAFDGWSNATPEFRADVLERAAAELFDRVDELGDLLSREEGKTLAEGKGEVGRSARILKFFAGEALRMNGDLLRSTRPGVDIEVTREALGVVGIITPWNFPIAIPAWKIAPALAYGNCVVFKPADLTPGCAYALVDVLHRAGLPKGVLNIVFGSGSIVGNAIVTHNDVDAVSFTGSDRTGSDIRSKAASRGARVQLEMGGKNPLLVLDDADMDTAVNTAINGAYFSTGQRCTASSRLIVTSGIHDAFVERLQKAAQALEVGDARNPKTQIGPVVSEKQLLSIEGHIDRARKNGVTFVGGARLERENPGHYFEPAIALEANVNDPINREEIFGPVASVLKVKDYEAGLALANDTEFGLSSGIVTTSLKHAVDFKKKSKVGMVMVNLPTAGVDYHAPFGGTKASSYGPREQGTYAREFYTKVKTAYTSVGG